MSRRTVTGADEAIPRELQHTTGLNRHLPELNCLSWRQNVHNKWYSTETLHASSKLCVCVLNIKSSKYLYRYIGWGCLGIGCWGEYLVVRGTMEQGSGENDIVRSLMICTAHPILHGWNRGAGKSLARPGRKHANVSVRMASISFGALPCSKNNLMTARVSMLLKSRASLTCFRSCFLPGRANDLSAPRYSVTEQHPAVRIYIYP